MAQATLPNDIQQFLARPLIAHLATVMRDGSPHVTPVWVDTDGTHVLVNTSEGRIKVRNMRRDPRVAVSLVDPADAYRGALQIRGTVVEITADGANDHIDRLAHKYTGAVRYGRRGSAPAEVRLIVRIRPERISGGLVRG